MDMADMRGMRSGDRKLIDIYIEDTPFHLYRESNISEDLQMTQAPKKEREHPFSIPPWEPPETPIILRDPNAPRIKTKDPRRLFNGGYDALTDFERSTSLQIARSIIPDPTPSGRARLAPTTNSFSVPLTTDTDGTPQAPDSSRQAPTLSDPDADARHQPRRQRNYLDFYRRKRWPEGKVLAY
jgi:hypothetical protein